MGSLDLAAVLVVLAAAFRYLNDVWLRLPAAVGVMALALGASLLLGLTGALVPRLVDRAQAALGSIDLNRAFLHGMLGFILFAGALKTDLNELAARKWAGTLLATFGVLISTALVGLLTWGLLTALGVPVRPIYCFVFGALISPTDPVAVLAILKRSGGPKDTEVTITGESLFNDGVGVVVFAGLLGVATAEEEATVARLAGFFVWETVGGIAFGLGLGWSAHRLLRQLDNYQVEVLLTVALVAGGYTLADRIGVSGPLAIVAAGLLVGNHARERAMSATTLHNLDTFWELIDEALNAVLFVLLGLEVLVLAFTGKYLLAGVLVIPAVLAARWVAVRLPLSLLRGGMPSGCTARLLTWGRCGAGSRWPWHSSSRRRSVASRCRSGASSWRSLMRSSCSRSSFRG